MYARAPCLLLGVQKMEHAPSHVMEAIMAVVARLVALVAPSMPAEIRHSRKRGGQRKGTTGRNNTPLVLSVLGHDGKTIAREEMYAAPA